MRTLLGGRLSASRRSLGIAAVDLLLIAAFVAAGEISHAGTLAAGVETFAEFGFGWAVAAPLVGAYGDRALDSPGRAAGVAAASWVPAAAVGQVVRAAVEPAASIAPAFVAVSLGVGLALLVPWRAAAAWHLG